MPYITMYDEIFDEMFQIEINEEKACALKEASVVVSKEPFQNLKIKPQLRSERHPEFYRADDVY